MISSWASSKQAYSDEFFLSRHFGAEFEICSEAHCLVNCYLWLAEVILHYVAWHFSEFTYVPWLTVDSYDSIGRRESEIEGET